MLCCARFQRAKATQPALLAWSYPPDRPLLHQDHRKKSSPATSPSRLQLCNFATRPIPPIGMTVRSSSTCEKRNCVFYPKFNARLPSQDSGESRWPSMTCEEGNQNDHLPSPLKFPTESSGTRFHVHGTRNHDHHNERGLCDAWRYHHTRVQQARWWWLHGGGTALVG